MKPLYLGIIALVIILTLALLFRGNQPDAPSNLPDTTVPKPMQNDHMMSPEEHASMMKEGEESISEETGTRDTKEAPNQAQPTAVEHKAGMTETSTSNSKEKTIMVHGDNFLYDPKTIRVKQGDVVTIHFMSMNGFHDFVIDGLNVKSDKISNGGSTKVTFTASKKGTFEYYCSVGTHRANGMVGTLIVE